VVLATGLVLSPAILALIGVGVSLVSDLLDDPKRELGRGAKLLLVIVMAFGATVLVEVAGQTGGLTFDRQFWSRFVIVLAAAFVSHYGLTVPSGISKAIQDHLSVPVLSFLTSTIMRGVSPQVVQTAEAPEAEPLSAAPEKPAVSIAANTAGMTTATLAPTTYAPTIAGIPPQPENAAPVEAVPAGGSDPAGAVSATIDLSQAPEAPSE
jgi:hypothetical protein